MIRCRCTLPENCILRGLTASKTGVRVKVISTAIKIDRGLGLSKTRMILTPGSEELIEELRRLEGVIDLEVLGRIGRSAFIKLVHICPLADLYSSFGPPPTPFTVSNGKAVWELPPEQVELIRREFRSRGLGFWAKRERRNGALTRREREIVMAALEEGYYSYPRKVNLTELAAKLGLSKSYVSEVLARAESKLMKELV